MLSQQDLLELSCHSSYSTALLLNENCYLETKYPDFLVANLLTLSPKQGTGRGKEKKKKKSVGTEIAFNTVL